MRPGPAAKVRHALIRLDGGDMQQTRTRPAPFGGLTTIVPPRPIAKMPLPPGRSLIKVRPTITSCGGAGAPSTAPAIAAEASTPAASASASAGRSAPPEVPKLKLQPFTVERLRELMPSPTSDERQNIPSLSAGGASMRASVSDAQVGYAHDLLAFPRGGGGPNPKRLPTLQPRPDPPRLQLYGSGGGDPLLSSHHYAHNPLLLRPYIGAHHGQGQLISGRRRGQGGGHGHSFQLSALSTTMADPHGRHTLGPPPHGRARSAMGVMDSVSDAAAERSASRQTTPRRLKHMQSPETTPRQQHSPMARRGGTKQQASAVAQGEMEAMDGRDSSVDSAFRRSNRRVSFSGETNFPFVSSSASTSTSPSPHAIAPPAVIPPRRVAALPA